jgi:hypothetical protein
MLIPFDNGTPGDATKMELISCASDVYQLKTLAAITDDFADLTGWTEVDSGSNVNLVGDGTVSLTGNNAYAANGLSRAITLAEGYVEFQCKQNTAFSAAGLFAFLRNAAGLPNSYIGAGWYGAFLNSGTSNLSPSCNGVVLVDAPPVVVNTYYTVRLYVNKNTSGAYKKFKITILGGIYTTETLVCSFEGMATAFANPFYVSFQVNVASANLSYIKAFRWYSGYSTAGEPVDFVSDAGAGKAHDGFKFSTFALPVGYASTNLKIGYVYSDTADDWTYGTWATGKTLAQFNALADLTTRKRYAKIRLMAGSDGATQQYAPRPLMETNNIYDVTYLTPAEEAVRNTLTENGAADVLKNKTWMHLGEPYTGSLPPGGGGSLAGKLNKIRALSVNTEKIIEESGVSYIVTYDNDGVTEIRRCAMKTFAGTDIDSLDGTVTPSQRIASTTEEEVAPVTGCLREKIDKLLAYETNKMVIAEYPTGSGEYYRIIYDTDNTTVILKQRLYTFDGQDLGSLLDSGEPSQRLLSDTGGSI